VVGAAYVVLWLLARFAVVTIPLAIALLLAALAAPLVDLADRTRLHRKVSSLLVVVGGLTLLGVLLRFVGSQVAQGFSDLVDQVVSGLDDFRTWLAEGPLGISESQIDDSIAGAQDLVSSGNDEIVSQVTEVGVTIGHFVAGFFIVLFASYFFLADGARIWAWMVRLFPRGARERADSSGKVAWKSLTQFVRATVLVALVDAIGIVIVAAILRVPFLAAIGVLVFLGAFIPMIGATLSGSVAVLVALVEHGWVVALLMFGGVILVQQIEAHILQPFLLGRFVSVHPLGVIVAIACGVLVAGLIGALVAVPLVAALNAVVQHLNAGTEVGEDAATGKVNEPGAVGE
jgi:predicted PurR-regulated permease PerM